MTEEEKKKLAEEKLAREQQEEEEKYRLMLEAGKQTPKPRNEEEIEMDVVCGQDSHWKKIIESYQKEFPNEKPPENGMLTFPDHASAQKFFSDRAKEGLEFLATRVVDGKCIDEHFFSCGDGKSYEGSFAQIHQQLQVALKAETNPDMKTKITMGIERMKGYLPKENPAVEMRNSLKESKKEAYKPDEVQSATPLKQKPNPFS